MAILRNRGLRPFSFAGRAAGSFGGAGGALEFFWIPNPLAVSNEIFRIADYVHDVAVPLRIAKEIARADMRRKFRTQTDPRGHEWHQWSASYAPIARRTNKGKILQRTGKMEEAAVSEEAWVVTGNMLFFNTANMPRGKRGEPYWYFHETGTAEEYEIHFAGRTLSGFENIAVGAGNALPPRPFIDISDEGRLQILEAVDQWFDGGIELGGVKVNVARGARGRFVSVR